MKSKRKGSSADIGKICHPCPEDGHNSNNLNEDNLNKAGREMKRGKPSEKKKRKKEKVTEADFGNNDHFNSEDERIANKDKSGKEEKGKEKWSRKMKSKKKGSNADIGKIGHLDEHNSNNLNDGWIRDNSDAAESSQFVAQGMIQNSLRPEEPDVATIRTHKSKKAVKNKKADRRSSKKGDKLLDNGIQVEPDTIYHIPSVDEDCSKGMKKWLVEYNQSRPGLPILQERIDEFITAHEEKEEQERKEREARVAEDGWTVVVHHKGRKKTTDSESGITVGSVSQAAVVDKMAKKKNKEVGQNFYRFSKREAHRNEIMVLQSKFEEDRKRIHQLRAARKFRPY